MKLNNLSDQPDILRAALVGYQIRQEEVERKIREVKGMLAGEEPSSPPAPSYNVSIHAMDSSSFADAMARNADYISQSKTKRNISAAGLERIAAATRLRWKRYRREKRKAA